MSCKPCDAEKNAALKVTDAVLRKKQAPPEIIEERRSICRACEFAVPCALKPHLRCSCSRCGCRLKWKTSLAYESCPLEIPKWSFVDVSVDSGN